MAEQELQVKEDQDELTTILGGDTTQETEKEVEEEDAGTEESGEGESTEGDSEESDETEGEAAEEEGEEESEEGEEEPSEEDKLKAELDSVQEENVKLRSYLRGMKQDIAVLKAKSVRDDASEDDEDKPEPTDIEKVSHNLSNHLAQNERVFMLMAGQMRMSDEYNDLDDVCSEQRWDQVVDAATDGIVAKDGVDPELARLQIESFIWNQGNPYEYMYGLIKEYHPDFKEDSETKSSGSSKTVTKKGSKKEPKSAPSSVAKVSSSSAAKSGWTSKKIDEMNELDLSKVPPDIYDKYMKGELP